MSRTPGSGNGSVRPCQEPEILVRIAVTARKAVCLVSRSYLPAERNRPPASNVSAAWVFCSAVRDYMVPNQMDWTRQTAIVARSRSGGVVLSVADRPLAGRVSMRSSKVLMKPPGVREVRINR
jgi:hypothetical protein